MNVCHFLCLFSIHVYLLISGTYSIPTKIHIDILWKQTLMFMIFVQKYSTLFNNSQVHYHNLTVIKTTLRIFTFILCSEYYENSKCQGHLHSMQLIRISLVLIKNMIKYKNDVFNHPNRFPLKSYSLNLPLDARCYGHDFKIVNQKGLICTYV